MPIASEERAAAAACREEAGRWLEIAVAWDGTTFDGVWNDLPPVEAAVVGFHDPAEDLERRAEGWHHHLDGHHLGELCRFGAGLAAAEADAWEGGVPDVAVRASEDRRFLLGDRILHWAVPWLDAAGRCHPECRLAAHGARETLLALGDLHRPAPDLGGGSEGVFLPGEDSYGPVAPHGEIGAWLASLWSGNMLFRVTLEALTGRRRLDRLLGASEVATLGTDLAILYVAAAARWSRVGDEHPGSARLWRDLAERARVTAAIVTG